MAYMDQTKKAKIAAELKKVVPAGWKYSLSVEHHSTIVMNISSAPVNLTGEIEGMIAQAGRSHRNIENWSVNHYYLDHQFGESLPVITEIVKVLNTDNWNRSDVQSDYHDVGHYIKLNIGRWNKPFEYKARSQA